jgi:phage FluMu protein Com
LSRIVRCQDCEKVLNEVDKHADPSNCDRCGSNNIGFELFLTDKIKIHDQIKGKGKMQGIKKPRKETLYGDDLHRTENKWRDKIRIIDRENDHYYEKIVNKETGEIIHECDEPLSEHWSHGSAKRKD